MADPADPGDFDPALLPYLTSASDTEADGCLRDLLETHAAPLIRRTVAGAMRAASGTAIDRQEMDDVCADVIVRLISRLQTLRESAEPSAVVSFQSYVAVAAYHACYEHLRSRYPGRWRLKNRCRYLLSHRNDLAIWESSDRHWLAGLAEHARSGKSPRPISEIRGALDRQRIPAEESFADAVRAVLAAAGGPVALDDLVGLVAARQRLDADATVTWRAPAQLDTQWLNTVPDPRRPIEIEIDQRRYLQALWHELLQLPIRQRTALLLNLRDAAGGSAIDLFPATGVASIRRLAEALALPAAAFAALWPRLPLDDDSIGARLGLKRQQVINLRKSARDRLARRLKALAFPIVD